MSSCARVENPRCLRRLAIGAQVSNLPHMLKLTRYQSALGHLFTKASKVGRKNRGASVAHAGTTSSRVSNISTNS